MQGGGQRHAGCRWHVPEPSLLCVLTARARTPRHAPQPGVATAMYRNASPEVTALPGHCRTIRTVVVLASVGCRIPSLLDQRGNPVGRIPPEGQGRRGSTSKVKATVACPRRSLTTFAETPACSAGLACVCRRSCGCRGLARGRVHAEVPPSNGIPLPPCAVLCTRLTMLGERAAPSCPPSRIRSR